MHRSFLEQFARIGKALSSHVRLELLDLLCQGEKSVELLVEQSGHSMKNVSAQLKGLKEAGLIKARREGKHVFYSLSDEKVGAFWSNMQEFSARQLSELQVIAAKLLDGSERLESVDRKELMARAKKEDVILIDVRPEDEFAAAHLPYARSIPLSKLKEHLKGLPKNKEIVAYCRGPHCLYAAEAVKVLRSKGYRASRLDDGIQEWKAAGQMVIRPRGSQFPIQ